MSFDLVVAADLDWGIGKDNGLPWPRLKGDLAHFKAVTSTASAGQRNAIVMGRRTWESREVGARPLPNRVNVVVSRSTLIVPEGVVAARTLDDAIAVSGVESIFVIGGAQIFREAFTHPALRFVYLTRVEGRFGCDAAIPDLDRSGFRIDPWDGERAYLENGLRYQIERLRLRPRT